MAKWSHQAAFFSQCSDVELERVLTPCIGYQLSTQWNPQATFLCEQFRLHQLSDVALCFGQIVYSNSDC